MRRRTKIHLVIFSLVLYEAARTSAIASNIHKARRNIGNFVRSLWRDKFHRPTRAPIRQPLVDIHTQFIHHSRAESDLHGTNERINKYEVQIVVGIISLILKVANRSEEVVVLTPYFSQLILIRKALILQKVHVKLGGADRDQLAGLQDVNITDHNSSQYAVWLSSSWADPCHVNATSFVVSLVSSNDVGDAGLLSDPFRIHSLFNLPKVPKYIVGNLDTFTSSTSSQGRTIWQGYKVIMERQKQVLNNFAAFFCRHQMGCTIEEPNEFASEVRPANDCPLGNLSSDLSAIACSCLADRVQSSRIDKCVETNLHNEPSSLCDADLKYVLGVYNDRGALQADNALDRIISAHRGSESYTAKELFALQCVLHSELGLKDGLRVFQVPFCPGRSLADAVCCWAHYTYLKSQHSIEAAKCARRLIAFSESHPSVLPERWVDEASKALEPRAELRNVAPAAIKLTVDEQWSRLKVEDPKAPAVLSQVFGMIGIPNVKNTFISLYHRHKLAKDQNDPAGFVYNARLEGSPGTGKTITARHYAEFLKQLGLVPSGSKFLEISGAILAHEGISRLKIELGVLKNVGGGVVLIDYALPLISTQEGKGVLNFISPIAEEIDSEYGSIVWLMSGFTKDMEQVLSYNSGLSSRFPIKFAFQDFDDDELLQLFNDLLIYQPITARTELNLGSLYRDRAGNWCSKDAFYGFENLETIIEVETVPKDGIRQYDTFGHSWTSENGTWQNDFGGLCAYSPRSLGTPRNPLLVSRTAWIYDNSSESWISIEGENMTQYPSALNTRFRNRRSNPFRLEDPRVAAVAIRRLGRQRGDPSFDNARAVRRLFEQVRSRQAQRIRTLSQSQGKPDIFLFTRGDLLGPSVTVEMIRSSPAYQELHALEGLTAVKKSVEALIKLAAENVRREEDGMPVLDIVINRVFLGNPGTGKTTVAGIYGRLLALMGLLSKGEVLLKNPSDFLGDVVGSSEKRTRDILSAAQGCVLVIDEAYSLNAGVSNYGMAVINTIVEQVPAKPGDDRAVLLLGYKEEMMQMLKNANPGLTRRFQLENAFEFEDYDDEALLRILLAKVKSAGLRIDFSVAKRAVASLGKARAKPHFGNAGAVETMLSEAKLRLNPGEVSLTLADFGLQDDQMDNRVLDTLLNDLVGCEAIKSKLRVLSDTVKFALARGDDPKENVGFNYLFLGNPGTGKSTVARRMGKMFKALGLLPSDEVRDISASDLVTGFVGQAGKKTRDILQSSRGGVLLVDEAYQLNSARGGSYVTEALDELVKCLTSAEFQGKLLVILAGYNQEMEEMLEMNTGLKSRFQDRLHFEDISPDQAAELMVSKMKFRKLAIANCANSRLAELAARLVKIKDFSNGRDVDTWSTLTYQEVSRNAKTETIARRNVTFEEMEMALSKLSRSRSQGDSHPVPKSGQLTCLFSRGQQPVEQFALKPNLRHASAAAKLQERRDDACADQAPRELEEIQDNPFSEIDRKVLLTIQDAFEEMGMNTQESVTKISEADGADPVIRKIVEVLIAQGIAPDEAEELLQKWQRAHKQLSRQVEEVQSAQERKGVVMRPIWRCSACGRGGFPWIVCFVAPYIERFEAVSQPI